MGVRHEGESMVWRPESLARPRPAEAGLLLVVAAGAWAGTVLLAQGMAEMTGTMGLDLAAFVAVWTLMMAAMMLPSVAPTASRYARSGSGQSGRRTAKVAGLATGYLAVWAAAGTPGWPAG